MRNSTIVRKINKQEEFNTSRTGNHTNFVFIYFCDNYEICWLLANLVSLSLSTPFAWGVLIKFAETLSREMVRVIYRTLILSGRAMCNTSDTERYFNLFCYDLCQEKMFVCRMSTPKKTLFFDDSFIHMSTTTRASLVE